MYVLTMQFNDLTISFSVPSVLLPDLVDFGL